MLRMQIEGVFVSDLEASSRPLVGQWYHCSALVIIRFISHADPLISGNNLLTKPSNSGASEQSLYLSTNSPSFDPPVAPLLPTSVPSMTVPLG